MTGDDDAFEVVWVAIEKALDCDEDAARPVVDAIWKALGTFGYKIVSTS
jgi:hypothetical protein